MGQAEQPTGLDQFLKTRTGGCPKRHEAGLQVQVHAQNFPPVVKKSPLLRVLIVEDERLIRWSIAETLEHAGHVVIEAVDGASAVRSLTNLDEPFDAVVLDYRLPDSNDLGLLAHIRRLSPRSVVILMTAFGTPEIASHALDLGVYQVLNKPFEMQDLQSALVKACAVSPR
jgi:DNA-binding NtrC family response regulator